MPSQRQQDPHARARAAVTAQRGYRSIRDVAEGSGVSNSTWSNFENGRTGLTRNMRLAVMRSYGWLHDWPENPPPITDPEPAPSAEVAELHAVIGRLAAQVHELAGLAVVLERLTVVLQQLVESSKSPPAG